MITLQLDGHAARDVLAMLARGYAMARIELALPLKTARAPWLGRPGNYAAWERMVSARKLAYRDALLSVMDELPDVRFPEWRDYESPSRGGKFKLYISERARVAASEFADEILRRAGLADG